MTWPFGPPPQAVRKRAAEINPVQTEDHVGLGDGSRCRRLRIDAWTAGV